MQFHTRRPCKTACLALTGLLLAAGLAGQEACAKGPQPKPDFVIEWEDHGYYVNYGFMDFQMSGAVEASGSVALMDTWTEDGVAWARYRFGSYGSNYFEAVLPRWPEHRSEHDFVLEAGPDGFLKSGNLYVGDWAVGTAKVHIHRTTIWTIDIMTEEPIKVRYDAVYWTMECYLAQ